RPDAEASPHPRQERRSILLMTRPSRPFGLSPVGPELPACGSRAGTMCWRMQYDRQNLSASRRDRRPTTLHRGVDSGSGETAAGFTRIHESSDGFPAADIPCLRLLGRADLLR
ncbi:MAG TPA: hypothetical protein VIU82_04885, partial [Bosea sp. (in: a-proteobacteria)]